MVEPPSIKYSGLTIVLSEPSRHDKNHQLISGYAGQFFWNCLLPISRESVEIRTADYVESGYKEGTKVVVHLGEKATSLITEEPLAIIHGYPFRTYQGLIEIPTFAPQDAYDRKDWFGEEQEAINIEVDDQAEKTSGKTRRQNWRFWLRNDIKKAKRLLSNSFLPLPEQVEPNYILYPSSGVITEILTTTKNKNLFIDIETDKNLNITCFGFSFEYSQSIFVVPVKLYTNTLAYEEKSLFNIFRALAIAFRDNPIIAHNGIFDLFVLAKIYRIPFPKNIFDTMYSWHRIYPEVEKSLSRLVSYFTYEPYHKSEGVFNPLSNEQQTKLWNYNAKDVWTTKLIYRPLLKEINKYGVEKSVEQCNKSLRPYLTIMYQGMKLDIPKMKEKYEYFERIRQTFNRCLNIVVGFDLNPRSPLQVKKYLYESLGFAEPHKDPTNEKSLLKLLTKHNIPSIKIIIAARRAGKLASSLKFKTYGEDRLTTKYGFVETYRCNSKALLSFKSFKEKGYGTNVQNWDEEKRELVIPDEGKILIQADQSGAEALVVAWLVRDGKFRELFKNRIKPHTYIAMRIFKEHWEKIIGYSIDEFIKASPYALSQTETWKKLEKEIKKDINKYYVGKKTVHSGNYGIKAPTLQLAFLVDTDGKLVLTLQECKQFLQTYHETFPEIQEWHFEVRGQLEKYHRLTNLFGFPRIFADFPGEELWKKGYAFIPQSTVGCITHIGITNLQNYIEENPDCGLDILQNGHDSILAQCREEDKEWGAKIVKESLEQELTNFRGEKFRMKAEVKAGYNWGSKSEKNPKGLEEIKI